MNFLKRILCFPLIFILGQIYMAIGVVVWLFSGDYDNKPADYISALAESLGDWAEK